MKIIATQRFTYNSLMTMKMPNILGYSFQTKTKKPKAYQLHPATQPSICGGMHDQ